MASALCYQRNLGASEVPFSCKILKEHPFSLYLEWEHEDGYTVRKWVNKGVCTITNLKKTPINFKPTLSL